MSILGAEITLARVRSVPGIKIDDAGQVTEINGDAQILLQDLMNQFVELSGMIVKKTMESILISTINSASLGANGNPDALQAVQSAASPAPVAQVPATPAPQAPPVAQSAPQNPPAAQSAQPVMQKDTDNALLSANHDLEELNKMLNTLTSAK